jgi:hypothetical protein
VYSILHYKQIMAKEKTRQANWRLPESLLSDLREVAEKAEIPVTDVVRGGLRERVNRLKSKLAREEQQKQVVTTA